MRIKYLLIFLLIVFLINPGLATWSKFQNDNQNTGSTTYINYNDNGSLKWHANSAGTRTGYGGIVLDENYLYFIPWEHFFEIYYKNNGTIKQTIFGSDVGCSSYFNEIPTIKDGMIYWYCGNNLRASYTSNMTTKWTYPIEIYMSAPTIVGNVIIIGDIAGDISSRHPYHSSWIHAIYIENGTAKWTLALGNDTFFDSTVGIDSNNNIYIIEDNGILYSINIDGNYRWKYTMPELKGYGGNSVSIKNDIIFAFQDTTAEIINANKGYAFYSNGSIKWQTIIPNNCYLENSISVSGTVVYFATECPTGIPDLYAYDIETGVELWNYSVEGAYSKQGFLFSPPMIDGVGVVYVGSEFGKFYAFYPNGTEKWNFTASNSAFENANAIDIDGVIYASNYFGDIYAFDSITPAPTPTPTPTPIPTSTPKIPPTYVPPEVQHSRWFDYVWITTLILFFLLASGIGKKG